VLFRSRQSTDREPWIVRILTGDNPAKIAAAPQP
jgi:hypothetical protein